MASINKISYGSAAKVFLVYGLIVGIVELVFSLIGGVTGLVIGVMALIFGIIGGAIGGIIFAAFYNFLISKWAKLESA